LKEPSVIGSILSVLWTTKSSKDLIGVSRFLIDIAFPYRTGGFSCYKAAKVCKLIVSSIVVLNICITKEIPILKEDEVFRDQLVYDLQQEQEHPNEGPHLFEGHLTANTAENLQ